MHVPFESVRIDESNEPLVHVRDLGLLSDPQYFRQGLTEDSRVFARKSVVEKLVRVEEMTGMKVKVFDAWRPRRVQKALYEKFRDELKASGLDKTEDDVAFEVELYVSNPYNPQRIPPHSTGGAVDITLATWDGVELSMGTRFDYFGIEAHSRYFEEYPGNDEARKNRTILRDAMSAQGFVPYKEEWWHFDYGNQKWAFDTGGRAAIYGEIISVP